ncbi:unnamed protein product, partial [Pleuronectes platessa]
GSKPVQPEKEVIEGERKGGGGGRLDDNDDDEAPHIMRLYLQPIQVALVVQLLQDGSSIRSVTRRFAVSPAQRQEHGEDTRRLTITQGELDRVVEVKAAAGPVSAPLCEGGTGGALPEPYK